MAQPLVEKGVAVGAASRREGRKSRCSAQVTASAQQELRLNDKSLAGYDMTSLNAIAIALRFNP
ncbi:hypothetical protein [Nostoc sp. 'Peltigera malacea cyanobiont' DB3992]|uniref:hypothetical protein n=1 Tax=Nostoc sp. 'Peltigera malacea cyanobiont' DB3992 TaxID=1206980 RepID=UPI0011811369|nr:hypothetical protein [Nostoc sp. 'Peltigera malacea cyanobiont' DB3992]